jgi:hypothetical protein
MSVPFGIIINIKTWEKGVIEISFIIKNSLQKEKTKANVAFSLK